MVRSMKRRRIRRKVRQLMRALDRFELGESVAGYVPGYKARLERDVVAWLRCL